MDESIIKGVISTRRDPMKRKAAEEDVEEPKRMKKEKQDWRTMHKKTTCSYTQYQRHDEWKVLTAFGAKHQWQLIETELAQKKALLRGTHKVMMSTEGKNDLLIKSLEKLYEDVEQLEMKLEKAKKKEEDTPATSSSKF